MKVNLKLLKKLYLINRPSGSEEDMISFIINYCYKIPKLKFTLDCYDNLFIEKNTTNPEQYPCIVAHMDSVWDFAASREIIKTNDVLTSTYLGEPCGLNADDSNGILVALQLLETLPNVKVCFTTEEKSGGFGADKAAQNIDFFYNVKYLIQADRKGAHDLIIYTNNVTTASDEFLKDIKAIKNKYNYISAKGLFTDIGILSNKLGISGVNVSCGYYNEHTVKEYCNIIELQNCLNFIYEIITTLEGNNKIYYISTIDETLEDFNDPCKTCSSFDCINCHKYDFF